MTTMIQNDIRAAYDNDIDAVKKTRTSDGFDVSDNNDPESDLSDIMLLLQQVYQKMRDMLQKQNVSQTMNSYTMAMNAIDKKKAASQITYEGGITAGALQIGSGLFSAVVGGTVGTGVIRKPSGFNHGGFLSENKASELTTKLRDIEQKMPTIKFADETGALFKFKEQAITSHENVSHVMNSMRAEVHKNFEKNKGVLTGSELKDLKSDTKNALSSLKSLEKELMKIAPKHGESRTPMVATMVSQAISGLGNAAGTIVTSNATKNAASQQVQSESISSNQAVYDKQSDKDANNMKEFSHKITETTRSLTDLHNAMANAVMWK